MSMTADLLDNAAKAIEENGWCQRTGRKKTGELCMLGAVDFASYAHGATKHARGERHKAHTVLRRHLNSQIAVWNDKKSRTREDVLKALRGAAAGLREEEDG